MSIVNENPITRSMSSLKINVSVGSYCLFKYLSILIEARDYYPVTMFCSIHINF